MPQAESSSSLSDESGVRRGYRGAGSFSFRGLGSGFGQFTVGLGGAREVLGRLGEEGDLGCSRGEGVLGCLRAW